MNVTESLDEPILDDDYIMYNSYAYVVDGAVNRMNLPYDNMTVREYKMRSRAKEVRSCDLFGRGLLV